MTFYVYAIGTSTSPTKIGFTNNLQKRLSAIQTGNPENIVIHHFVEFDTEKEMREAEKRVHKVLGHLRKKGEWFDILPEDAKLELDYIRIMI